MMRPLEALLDELRRDLTLVEGMRVATQAKPGLLELSEDLESQLGRSTEAAVITLVGATGAGKSTLLNALVEAEVAVPGENRPTTSAPVVYAPRDAQVQDLLKGLPGKKPKVVAYDPQAHGPWTEQILIDAPDTNSIASEHREVVRALAERSDVLVVVVHRQSVAELAAATFVDDFAGRRGLIFVLGRADELGQETQDALAQQLRTIAHERWGVDEALVHALAPLTARDHPTPQSWIAFEEELQRLVRGGRLNLVRRHNTLGCLALLQTCLSSLGSEGRADLAAIEVELDRSLETWLAAVLDKVRGRLALRARDLTHLLWAEVGRRWDGPGGWAIRVGGLSALGVGAGMWFARRNPLLAAGAAVTAVAADRVRGGLQERSFQDPGGLLPGPGELAEWEQSRMASLRLAVAEAGDSTLGIGQDELASAAGEAVAEVWGELVEQEIPALAAGSEHGLLRLLVDGPVFAFGAWIVFCAGRGFWSGHYVGLDFLVNAALLLGAWLLVTRSLLRSWLGRRAQALLAGAEGALGQRFGSATERASADLRQAILARQAAFERLEGLEGRWREALVQGPGKVGLE